MTFELRVVADSWRRRIDELVEATPGLVPVVKGNGYGLGRDLLAAEATRIGADLIAVGSYSEVPGALAAFGGDVLVLSPWRPFLSEAVLDPRVVHTLGRVDDVAALAERAPGARILLEGRTSMLRHGLDRHELAAAARAAEGLAVEGLSIHLPMEGGQLAEAQRWAGVLLASQIASDRLFVSHLTPAELDELRETRPQLSVRPRIGTRLWHGDGSELGVWASVLDVHPVRRGDRVGYRQRAMPRDGHIVIVEGGTSHSVGLEAPRAVTGAKDRAKSLAYGVMEAAGLALAPFAIGGRRTWFAEPPHMQASMLFLPAGTTPPEVGEAVPVTVRHTIASFDAVRFV
ncbi:MAG: alanine racemase [Aeromicrobium sp.]|uniref:alanine racemase n=1 Tax=Aeromicrobium sp. TaxID=1871063 RepID=UPI0039E59DDA